MQNILIVFFIICFIILVFVFPFKIRAMGHFNFLNLLGFYSLKIMKLRLINGRIIFENGEIKIENSVNIIEEKFSEEFSKNLIKEILARINVKKVELFFSGGIADNSFTSAIMCGGVSSIVQSVFSFLTQRYENVKLYEDVDAKFGENNLELTFDFVISISFLSIIISIIKAMKGKTRELKNEK